MRLHKGAERSLMDGKCNFNSNYVIPVCCKLYILTMKALETHRKSKLLTPQTDCVSVDYSSCQLDCFPSSRQKTSMQELY